MKDLKSFLILPITALSLMASLLSSDSPTDILKRGYTQLTDGVYISKLPGFYSTGQSVSFIIDKNLELYYSLDYQNNDISKMALYKEPILINKSESRNKADFPITTSVDAILPDDKEGKCVSEAYINNIQKTENYILFDKQPVLKINVVNKNNKETVFKRSFTYLFEDKITKDINIPVVSLSMPYDDIMGSNGFYNKIREDISRRADLEFFDPEYNEYFPTNGEMQCT